MPTALPRPFVATHSTCREQAFTGFVRNRSRHVGQQQRCRANNERNGSDPLSDRLKAAEAEAAALRKQLAAAREGRDEEPPQAVEEQRQRRPSRIDGSGLQRESPFAQGPGQWLSEANFLKGLSGPSEAVDAVTSSPEEAATVKRRLLIGGIGTVVVVGLSLLPTDSLRLSRPSKPLFFYLVPLLRVQALLKGLETAAIEGKPEEVASGIARIEGAPNYAVENLRSAAASLPDSRSAEKARVVARDVIEYLDSIDYNKYFESLEKPSARSGERQKMFLDFSLNSVRAAQAKLKAFLALMPAEQLEAASQQVNASF